MFNIPIVYEDEDVLVINKPAGVVVNRAHTVAGETLQDWVEARTGVRGQGLGERQVDSEHLPACNAVATAGRIVDREDGGWRTLRHTQGKLEGERTENKESRNKIQESRNKNLEPRYKNQDLRSNFQIETPNSDQEDFYQDPEEIFLERSGIAHRLDKETSGVLLIAKHPDALVSLLKQFKAHTIQKTYLALVHGKVGQEVGEIDLPIGRNPRQRLQFAVVAEGRSSLTTFTVVERFLTLDVAAILKQRTQAQHDTFTQNARHLLPTNFKKAVLRYQGFTLLEAYPKTGRTHQIRVHFAHLKHPLVGDALYAGKKRGALDAVWCPRHFLHAQSIRFEHPRTGERMTITAELPSDLKDVLGMLH